MRKWKIDLLIYFTLFVHVANSQNVQYEKFNDFVQLFPMLERIPENAFNKEHSKEKISFELANAVIWETISHSNWNYEENKIRPLYEFIRGKKVRNTTIGKFYFGFDIYAIGRVRIYDQYIGLIYRIIDQDNPECGCDFITHDILTFDNKGNFLSALELGRLYLSYDDRNKTRNYSEWNIDSHVMGKANVGNFTNVNVDNDGNYTFDYKWDGPYEVKRIERRYVIRRDGIFESIWDRIMMEGEIENDLKGGEVWSKYKYVINDPDGYVNLREKKSTSSEIISKVSSGEEVIIYSMSGNWWQVKTLDGMLGYIHNSRIKVR